ncbi:membrane protease YdiL (CAAX protease family) [Saccharothrix ecbatanensis]|uniref:Membrane protease YdiL (CAAX protease family) n=1 Tax=Saccharothrix ecbatanensis TaxID=1105145 RepID=A0A7W9HNW3_9PSEU|nr:CPBP family intramembrane glutamic endopeptidase [Saccharothrix ecbatanensis]MBB5805343.1 membrane protease YdiL (CAAX protease family) [Saccharothrix ecbatanensis]
MEEQQAQDTGRAHWGFLAFFVGLAGYHVATLVFTAATADRFAEVDITDPPVLGPLLLLVFLPNVLLGLGPVVVSWRMGNGPNRDFGLVPTWRDVKVGLAAGGAALLAAWLVGALLLRFNPDQSSSLEQIEALSGGRTVWLAAAALFVLIGAPLTEEVLTRGALWQALAHYKIPRFAILALTALIFAFLHEESWRMIGLFAQGLAIGAARMITGRVAASVVAHAANNLLPAVYLYTG